MKKINEFKDHCDESIQGEYRVIGNTACWNERYGRLVQKLTLADYTGVITVCVRFGNEQYARNLPLQMVIHADITPRCLESGDMGGIVEYWSIPTEIEILNAAAVIPSPMCPAAAYASLVKLVQWVDGVQAIQIRHCANRIIHTWYHSLLQAQGGWQYHHNYPGGLLAHTVGVMEKTATMAGSVYPADPHRVDLLVLAAMIHDLGKGLTTIPNQTSTVARELRHETLSVAMALPALQGLETEWPEAAQYVANVVDWLTTPAASRYPKRHEDAQLVQMSDVWDVIQDRVQHHG